MVDAGRSRSTPRGDVLYVDPDEAGRRRTLRGLAAGDSVTAEGVATAGALRDALADDASAYACVVTEYRLEETDALALYDSLRADGLATVPFVLYTDAGNEALASEAITAGFSGYVPKGPGDSLERLREQLRTVAGADAARHPASAAGNRDGTRADGRDGDLERYRTLVETVGDSMYVLDAVGRIEMANEAMADVLGTTREELVGRRIDEFLVDDDAGRVRATVEELHAADDRAWDTLEVTVEFADEETCDAEVNVAPRVDEDGTPAGSVGVVRDVSDRKERERGIRRLHDGTRRLMAATERDEIARIVAEIADDALGLDLNSVHLYESDVTTRSASAADAVDSASTDVAGSAGDGTTTETTAETAPRVVTSSNAGLETSSSASVDESEPKGATEDETGTEGENENGGGHGDERRGGLVPVAMSDRALDLFGGAAPYIEPGGGIAWDAYEAGEAIVHGDVRRAPNVRNPDTPVRSEAHVPLGDHGILIVSSLEVNDFDPVALTLARILAANAEAALDRAERETELAARSRELERQNERLEAFASTVSHDLRNPLTLAMGHLELLADRIDDGDGDGESESGADRHVEEIEWALERMDELIENVLTLARSGRQLTDTEPVDLAALVERAHRTVDPALAVAIDDPLPTVEGDAARLRVLFENVLRNAREHGGTDVTVAIEPTPEGFVIADDGPGIDPAERERILEWGYSTNAEGTGFGLAIVSEVVEAHGWSMTVGESDAGGLRLTVATEESGSRPDRD